ncbi:MAG: exodeoxyribonuclease III [Chitinivibrionia bacterium]|nr:exodeoxyribonuclease III [Chitinivibrionia bacterium]
MKIYSWNVNGIRACAKNGFFDFFESQKPDVLAIQETKAQKGQLSDNILNIDGYESFWHSATKKGYSGTAIYTKIAPKSVENIGSEKYDCEGRTIIVNFENFTLVNCYFPNSQDERMRLDYKLGFCDFLLWKLKKIVESGKNVILVGDYNIAHNEIDLKNPKNNENSPGFYWEEREWMTKFLSNGFCDIFRQRHPNEPNLYTWWSYRTQARERNVGWRIDYCCVNDDFVSAVKNVEIHPQFLGSDHCPISIEI